MPPVAAEEALPPRIGLSRVDEHVLRGFQAGEKRDACDAEHHNGDERGARVAFAKMRREPGLGAAPALSHEASAAARSSSSLRSRAFCVSEAARSNSTRASALRPSFFRKSPRTLGNR